MNALTPRHRPSALAWVDVAVTTVLSVIAIVGFTPAFGGWQHLGAGLGGILVGSVVAVIGALYRLSLVLTALTAVIAYFLFGSLFAMSGAATLGLLPNVETLGGLVTGAVFGWSDLITLQTPVGAPPYITVVPYVAGWIVSLVGVSLALRWLSNRSRFTAGSGSLLLIGPAVLFLAGILVGTHDPFHAAVRGVGFAAIALIWLGWRSRPTAENGGTRGRRVVRRKLVGTAALIAGAVAAGSLTGFVLAPVNESRFVLREHVDPPFDPLEFQSPLSSYRIYSKLRAEETIFTVSGAEAGQSVRLATLDSYDGVVWAVSGAQQASDGSGSYSLVGQNMPAPDFEVESTSRVQITIGDYRDVWLPSIGYATRIVFEGDNARELAAGLRYNAASGTGIVTSGLREGDSYVLESASPATSRESLGSAGPADVRLPPVAAVQVVGAKAIELSGSAETPLAQLEAIEAALQEGYLRHGLESEEPPGSRAGHNADRLIDLFSSTYLVGDQEQFASAFALMARSLGFPSRVVMGFVVPEGSGGSVAVTGVDVTAWVEVAFEGAGWIPFVPTPERLDVPQDQVPEPQTTPKAQVRQPPRTVENPDDLVSPIEIEEDEGEDETLFSLPGWVWVVVAWVGIPAIIFFVPLLIVAFLKRRRRRRRLAGPSAARIAGGWDELLDSYAEFGYAIPPRYSRTQLAQAISGDAEAAGTVLALAHEADRAMFADRSRIDLDAETYWTATLAEIDRVAGSAGRWRRFVNRFYVRPRLGGVGIRSKKGTRT